MKKNIQIVSLILLFLILPFLSGFTWTEKYLDCSDGGEGDGTPGDPWAALQEAYDEVAAGQRINGLASAECDISSAVNTATAGTSDLPIVLQGYTSSPGDGGILVVDGQSNAIDCFQIDVQFNILKDVEVKRCGQDNIDITAAGDNTTLSNLYINNAGDFGIENDNGGNQIIIIGCEFNITADDSINMSGQAFALYNYAHASSSYGLSMGDPNQITAFNIINTTVHPGIGIGSDRNLVIHNTVYNTTADGRYNLEIGSVSEGSVLINNIIQDNNAGDSIGVWAGGLVYFNLNNALWDSGGAGSKSGDIIYTEGEQTGDPDMSTTTFALGGSTTLDNTGYPTNYDRQTNSQIPANLEPGAIPYEE